MRTSIVTLVVLLIFSGCKKESKVLENQVETNTTKEFSKSFENKKEMDDLFNKVAAKGDTIAYDKLKSIYFLSGHRFDFLSVSILMSNKFKDQMAYYDTFTCLYRLNGKNDDTENWVFDSYTDPSTLKYALENLKKAAYMGNKDARKIIVIYKEQGRYTRLLSDIH